LAFIDRAFLHPEILAAREWGTLARGEDGSNPPGFEACLDRLPSAVVDSGSMIAERIGIRATPTLVLDGVVNPAALTMESIRNALARATR
jgi:protein-disulfide isomerase